MPTGMTTVLDRYLAYLVDAGVSFTRAPDLRRDPDQPGRPHKNGDAVRELRLEGLPPIREARDPARCLSACHATMSVARALVRPGIVRPSEPFWEVGCGTGVLAIAAALLGARPVLATDVAASALDLARRNVAAAGVDVEIAECSVIDRAGAEAFANAGALLAANLPHKPSRGRRRLPLAQDGGAEGDALFATLLDQAAALPGAVRLLFFMHSLPHPRVLARIGREYRLTLLSWKRRFLEDGEFGPLDAWYLERSSAGTSFVAEAEGRRFLVCGVWLAEHR